MKRQRLRCLDVTPLELASDYIEAFNRRDADAMEAMLHPSIRYVAAGETVAEGHQQVRDFYRPFFNTDVVATMRHGAIGDDLAFFEIELVGTLPDGASYRLVGAVRQQWADQRMVDYRSYPDPPIIGKQAVTIDQFVDRASAQPSSTNGEVQSG